MPEATSPAYCATGVNRGGGIERDRVMGMTARRRSYTVNHAGRALAPAVGERREAYEDAFKGLAPKPRARTPERADNRRGIWGAGPVGDAARTGRGRPGSRVQ